MEKQRKTPIVRQVSDPVLATKYLPSATADGAPISYVRTPSAEWLATSEAIVKWRALDAKLALILKGLRDE